MLSYTYVLDQHTVPLLVGTIFILFGALTANIERIGDVPVDTLLSGAGHVVRINKTIHANFVRYMPCLDDIADDETLAPFLKRPERGTTQQPLFTSRYCTPAPDKCFRAVLDGHEDLLGLDDEAMKLRMRSMVKQLIVRKNVIEDPLTLSDFHFGPITWNAENWKQAEPHAKTNGFLHSDYFQRNDWVYSVLLYGYPSDDLVGGETLFADAGQGFRFIDNDESDMKKMEQVYPGMELLSGMIVEPKPGRLVFFTGGGENIHSAMQVFAGERVFYRQWFSCALDHLADSAVQEIDVIFENKSGQTVELYWDDGEEAVLQSTLEHADEITIDTFIGHRFYFTPQGSKGARKDKLYEAIMYENTSMVTLQAPRIMQRRKQQAQCPNSDLIHDIYENSCSMQ